MEYSGRDTTEEARHEATSIKHGGKQDMDCARKLEQNTH